MQTHSAHGVGQKLSDNKNLMLGEHKTEVFERMQDKRSQLEDEDKLSG